METKENIESINNNLYTPDQQQEIKDAGYRAHAAGMDMTFMVFVGIGIICFLFILKFCPETKGRSLEEIEQQFRSEAAPNVATQKTIKHLL